MTLHQLLMALLVPDDSLLGFSQLKIGLIKKIRHLSSETGAAI